MGSSSSPSLKPTQQVAPWQADEAPLSPLDVENTSSERQITYLKGLQFHLVVVAVCIALFLTNLEIPIVTTSIVGITDDFGGFDRSSWIVSAYLLGYAGFIIIYAKLSDIFGRKLLLSTAVITFMIFSGACGAAQSLNQLIILRAFQGVGGGGCWAMGTIMAIELVPEAQYASLTALISMVFAISLVVGPIIGGAINNSTTWRWVFLINVPCACPALAIIWLCIPHGFPYHGQPDQIPSLKSRFSGKNLGRIDFIGGLALIIGTLALVGALEEAGLSFGWRSAFVITLLTVAGVLWIAFLLWERYVTLRSSVTEPVFPWRFVTSRICLGLFVNSLALGCTWSGAVFQLPQRFQAVNGVSAIGAGVRLLPFTAAAPIGSLITAALAKKLIPPIYLVMGASILQVVGFALLGTVGFSHKVKAAQYGFQVLAGFGTGTNISLQALMTPFSVQPQDKAVAMGAVTQFRIMGGAIGLSILNTAMHGYIRPRIASVVSPKELNAILDSVAAVATLSPDKREIVAEVLAGGYNLQMKILAGLAGIQILGTLLIWQKKQIRV